MPICPKCKKIISHLRQCRTGYEECEMFFNKKEDWIDWKNEEFIGDGNLLEYHCPQCDRELDFSEEEAEEFLENKDELQEIIAKKIEINKSKQK